ncbi:MAG: hypothetical protein IT168_16650 [Bryobacterales bacterium]|nr:hypothetical protein [Bryobacterales bacterium]
MVPVVAVLGLALLGNLLEAEPLYRNPVELRLLVLAASGSEPSLAAIRSTLDLLGTPYDTVVLGKGDSLPNLEDNGVGRYQGIVLATGNLGICDPNCRSALSADGWSAVERYMVDYGVRLLSYYTFPEPRYGIEMISNSPAAESTTDLRVIGPGEEIFAYLRRPAVLPVRFAYWYGAKMSAAASGETTPILEINGEVAGAVRKTEDGREYLAITIDQSPSLEHSVMLGYGLIRWVTRGVFVGMRRTVLNMQVDDLFLPNELFDQSQQACVPTELVITGILNPNSPCPRQRIAGTDLDALRAWQQGWNDQPQTERLRISLAFNGYGAQNDSLTEAVQRWADRFYWINHTYDHRNLDCFAADTNGCRGANSDEGRAEIALNIDKAAVLGIKVDEGTAVTPGISGLNNAGFLSGAAEAGLRYLVADASRSEYQPKVANTALRSAIDSRIVLIPRRATGIFYNTSRPEVGVAGSETDEYNHLFGPLGILKVNGLPFFGADQTYDDIVNSESNVLMGYMLKGEMYPLMFHQGNLYQYREGGSLLTDVADAALRKFTSRMTFPVESWPQSTIGRVLEQRLHMQDAGLKAVWKPGEGVQLTASRDVTVWMTGVCGDPCERYGDDWQTSVAVTVGEGAKLHAPQ